MTANFADLKKNRSAMMTNALKAIEGLNNGGGFKEDDRIWKPTVDKAGNGQATLRFLPPAPGSDIQFVRVYDHSFQVNGKWFINRCPTTLGYDYKCPVNV